MLKNVPHQRSCYSYLTLQEPKSTTQIKLPIVTQPNKTRTASTKQLKPTKPKTKIKIKNGITQTTSNKIKKHNPKITDKTTN